MTAPRDQLVLKLKQFVFAGDHSRALVGEIEGVLGVIEESDDSFPPDLLEGLSTL